MAIQNTGYKAFGRLRQRNLTTGLLTGITKPNVPSDPDYIPPVQDLTMCPTDTLSVSPISKSFNEFGGDETITVLSNVSWTVSSNQSWVTIAPNSGTGNSAFSITVESYYSTIIRTAIVTVTTSGGVSKTVPIEQAIGLQES